MPRLVAIVGVLLILLGLVGYFVLADPEARSVTALIPAFVGVPIFFMGLLGRKPGRVRKITMHVAMLLALLGAVAPWMRLVKAFQEGFELNEKTGVQLTMSLLCLVLLVLGIRSFITARRETAG